MLRTARGGLDRLPQAERGRLVAELDRFRLVVCEQVEPKALASDGSVVAWRFSSEDLPEAKLRPDASNDVTKSLDVRPAQVIVRHRPSDKSDLKECVVYFTWWGRAGHELKVGPPGLRGNGWGFAPVCEWTADPQPARATGAATEQAATRVNR
jgi:hypothetical protein